MVVQLPGTFEQPPKRISRLLASVIDGSVAKSCRRQSTSWSQFDPRRGFLVRCDELPEGAWVMPTVTVFTTVFGALSCQSQRQYYPRLFAT